MIRRQHVISDFFEGAEAMRGVLDSHFENAYAENINWKYFCDPRMYTYLKAAPQNVFPKEIFDRFTRCLRSWCVENLGLVPMRPALHLMVNGCRLGLHSDFHNGAFGYVYSLTRWDQRSFAGGETLLMRDGVPSYKKHHVQGEILYELIPARFNQLLVFDDRIVHATPTVEGSMNPMEGRIAIVGHIRAPSPFVSGGIRQDVASRAIREVLLKLHDRIRSYKDVQGTVTYRLVVGESGALESVTVLADNVITPLVGYDQSETVESVKAIIRQTIEGMKFPSSVGKSSITLPLLIPLPNLNRIEFEVPHRGSRDEVRDLVVTRMAEVEELELQGAWDGHAYHATGPILGDIRIEPRQIACSFEPPMWVPSQRERFQSNLMRWVERAAGSVA